MKAIQGNLTIERKVQVELLTKMLASALSNVPFHENTMAITRYFAEHFPLHPAVHKVLPVLEAPTASYNAGILINCLPMFRRLRGK